MYSFQNLYESETALHKAKSHGNVEQSSYITCIFFTSFDIFGIEQVLRSYSS